MRTKVVEVLAQALHPAGVALARDCCLLPTCCTALTSVMLAGRGCRHHGGWAKALRKREGADTALLALQRTGVEDWQSRGWAWRATQTSPRADGNGSGTKADDSAHGQAHMH